MSAKKVTEPKVRSKGLRRMWNRLASHAFVRDEDGMAAIEFALILPVMLVLFVGMVELTLRLSESRRTTLLSGMIGDLVAQSESGQISDSELDDYYAAARYVLLPFDDSRVLVRVSSFSYDSESDEVKRDWELTKGGLDEAVCPELTADDLPEEMISVIEEASTPIIATRVCRQQKTMISKMLGMNLEKSPIFIRESFFRPRYVTRINCTSCT
jgi:Flp pilus assembly pilin Flp